MSSSAAATSKSLRNFRPAAAPATTPTPSLAASASGKAKQNKRRQPNPRRKRHQKRNHHQRRKLSFYSLSLRERAGVRVPWNRYSHQQTTIYLTNNQLQGANHATRNDRTRSNGR